VKRSEERNQESEQQKPQPPDQKAEVVAGGSEDGVDGVRLGVSEIVAAHAMLGLEMPDDELDGGASAHLALDLRCHAPLLTCDEDSELVIGRRIVAAIAVPTVNPIRLVGG
jgi:hypothetical protein